MFCALESQWCRIVYGAIFSGEISHHLRIDLYDVFVFRNAIQLSSKSCWPLGSFSGIVYGLPRLCSRLFECFPSNPWIVFERDFSFPRNLADLSGVSLVESNPEQWPWLPSFWCSCTRFESFSNEKPGHTTLHQPQISKKKFIWVFGASIFYQIR